MTYTYCKIGHEWGVIWPEAGVLAGQVLSGGELLEGVCGGMEAREEGWREECWRMRRGGWCGGWVREGACLCCDCENCDRLMD